MIKVLLLTIAMTMSSNVMMGNPITVNDAKQKAQKFITSGKARRVKGNMNLSLAYAMNSHAPTADDDAALYVFNVENENGFVIVSGDDVAVPILGYSSNGSFDENNIPSNLKAWLDEYATQIQWARQHEAEAASHVNKSPIQGRTKIEAMLTSTWNQNEPFNDQCVFNGTRCLTGCMAVAMAQMMYYWATKGKDGQTFRAGCKALEGYTTSTNGYVLNPLDAITSFDWDNMTDEKPTTTASKAAVAQLLRYCGQALQANFGQYGTSGSMAKTANALKNYCGYNIGVSLENKYYYTQTEWEEMVYAQLAEGKPVIINGEKSNIGHGFICDGYDPNSDTYHMNWGWGGRYDGWFSMTSLNVDVYDLNDKNFAIININPLEESTYALLSSDQKTLTFYHDTMKDSREGTIYELNTSYNPAWSSVSTITDVVFDSSFAQARPKTTEYWFNNQANLKNITGIQYLNTSEVTSMVSMFNGCSSLTNLDVSHFNTSNVTTMVSMFNGCSSLTSLDVSQFNTSHVTTMASMFANCSSLTSLDVSSFVMSSDLVATNLFNGCKNLKDLYIPANMPQLSTYACSSIGTTKSPCIVHAPEGFDFGTDTSDLYFKWYSGYFFLEGTKVPYTIFDNGTLSFYHDHQVWMHDSIPMKLNTTSSPAWYSSRERVTTVVFDKSFAESLPTSTYRWFYGMKNLTEIKNIEYLQTSQVTTMESMFSSCSSLTSLDVSHFNTSNVTTMSSMFYGCSGLTTLDISKFDMSNVTNSSNMINSCKGLKDLYVPFVMMGLNTSAFSGVGVAASPCVVHAPEGFDFGEGVDTAALYFRWNSGYFYLDGTTLPYAVILDGTMSFYDDDAPWKREGTKYRINESTSPSWYSARQSVTSVIFDKSFENHQPMSIYRWFYDMISLTEIQGLNYLNMEKVTNVGQMFYNCGKLTSLNLSKFDLTNMTEFNALLTNCVGLKELYIHESMTALANNACSKIGTAESPCTIYAPETFDFGVDTSGDYFKWKSGYFCLGKVELLLGDVNGDGAVNVSDVILVVNNILGIDSELFHFENADINADGKIDVSDAVGITNIILNSSPM